MDGLTFVVPRGAEAAALRGLRARVVTVPAGAAAADDLALPPGARVVIVGLCGALGAQRAGDAAIVERIAGASATYDADPGLTAAVARVLAAPRVTARTVPHVVTRVAERRRLAAAGGAVIEMEGSHLAAALQRDGVPWACVRIVSDAAAHDLPPIGAAIDERGRLRPVRLAAAFARAPVAAVRFVHGVRMALAALRSAASALDDGL